MQITLMQMFLNLSPIRSLHRLAVFGLLFLLGGFVGLGMISAETTPSPQTETTPFASGPLHSDGRIIGTVTDPEGNPLADIFVQARQWDGERSVSNSRGVHSDSNGYFDLQNLPYDDHLLTFADTQGRFAPEFLGDTLDEHLATVIQISDDTPVRVTNSLLPGGVISGRVVHEDGTPATDSVSAYRFAERNGHWILIAGQNNMENGEYELTGLPAGTYRVGARDFYQGAYIGGYYPGVVEPEAATAVTIGVGETIGNIDFTLPTPDVPTGMIDGTVWDGNGAPLANITVQLYGLNANDSKVPWRVVERTGTDDAGHYRFETVEDGYYKVHFSDEARRYAEEYNDDFPTLGGAPVLTLDDSTNAHTVNASLLPGAVIRGNVASQFGYDIEGVNISLYRWNHQDAFLPVSTGGGAYKNFVDGSGNLQISGLQFGEYRIHFTSQVQTSMGRALFHSQWLGDVAAAKGSQTVYVGVGDSAEIGTVTVDALATTVSGQATAANTGEPIANASITLLSPTDYIYGTTETDADGRYAFVGIPPGRSYTLRFVDPDTAYVQTYLGNVRLFDNAQFITVEPRTPFIADFVVLQGARIKGRITAPSWFNLESGSASARHTDDAPSSATGTAVNARIDVEGYYEIRGLWPGSYKVKLSGSEPFLPDLSNRLASEWYDDVDSYEKARILMLAVGETLENINGEIGNHLPDYLRTDGLLSGVVSDENGMPLDNIRVYVYMASSAVRGTYWDEIAVTTTDASGQYWIGNLRFGGYRLGFADPEGVFSAEYWDNSEDFDTATLITIDSVNTQQTDLNATLTKAPDNPSGIVERMSALIR